MWNIRKPPIHRTNKSSAIPRNGPNLMVPPRLLRPILLRNLEVASAFPWGSADSPCTGGADEALSELYFCDVPPTVSVHLRGPPFVMRGLDCFNVRRSLRHR